MEDALAALHMLMGACERGTAAPAPAPPADRRKTADRENNRLAQQRFRDRQRAQVAETQERLAAAAAEIAAARREHDELLLESATAQKLLCMREFFVQSLEAAGGSGSSSRRNKGGTKASSAVATQGSGSSLRPFPPNPVIEAEVAAFQGVDDVVRVWQGVLEDMACAAGELTVAEAATAAEAGPKPSGSTQLVACEQQQQVVQAAGRALERQVDRYMQYFWTTAQRQPALLEATIARIAAPPGVASDLWSRVAAQVSMTPLQTVQLRGVWRAYMSAQLRAEVVAQRAQRALADAQARSAAPTGMAGLAGNAEQLGEAAKALREARTAQGQAAKQLMAALSVLWTPRQKAAVSLLSRPYFPDFVAIVREFVGSDMTLPDGLLGDAGDEGAAPAAPATTVAAAAPRHAPLQHAGA